MDGFKHTVTKIYKIISDVGAEVTISSDLGVHIGSMSGQGICTFGEEAIDIIKILNKNIDKLFYFEDIDGKEYMFVNHYEKYRKNSEPSVQKFTLIEETIEQYTKITSKEISL